MGRTPVIRMACDRCKRVEHRPASEVGHYTEDGEPCRYAFEGTYRGQRVKFEDLCTGCEAILDNHWVALSKRLKKASPIRRIDKG